MKLSLKTCQLFVAVATLLGAFTSGARASEMVDIRTVVEVDTPDLNLSDLLPEDTVDTLRDLARTVDLGRAPQIGYQRTLTRRFIENQIRGIGDLTGVLDVPPSVVVRRRGYEVNASDVQPSVVAALESSGCAGLLPLTAGEMSLRTTVFYSEPEPDFEVMGVDRDALRSEIQVRVRIVGGGHVPFFVTVPVPASDHVSAGGCSLARPGALVSRRQQTADAIVEAGPILVQVGQLATLQAVGRGLQFFMTVAPLEDGREGDVIRVRNTDSEEIVTARVIGPDLVGRDF